MFSNYVCFWVAISGADTTYVEKDRNEHTGPQSLTVCTHHLLRIDMMMHVHTI